MIAYKVNPSSVERPPNRSMCKFPLRMCLPRGRYNLKETVASTQSPHYPPSQATTGIKGKGRTAARPLPPPSSDLDADEIVPDSELEFEDLEDAIQNESLDDSSDDFVPEEDSESDVPQNQESDVPLAVSMTTPDTFARPSSSKAGLSFKAPRGRRPAAKMQSEVESSDSSDSDDSIAASKNPPRRKKAVPAGRKGRKGATSSRRPSGPRRRRGRRADDEESDQESDISDGLLEPSDDDAKPPPKGLQPHQIQSLIKTAERRMRKKLGRKLTMVQFFTAYPNPPHINVRSSAFSVTNRQSSFTSSTLNSRVVGETSRRPSPSLPLRRRNSPRTCVPPFYRSSRKAYTG